MNDRHISHCKAYARYCDRYWSLSPRPGVKVGQDMCPTQGFGFGNVATGQVVQKKVEFLQRAGSVGRGDSRDGLNPDIRSDQIIMPRSKPLVNGEGRSKITKMQLAKQ